MGWVAMVAAAPIIRAIAWSGFAWLAAGGIVYTVGIVFYCYDERFRHFHGVWHLFVLAGSAIHFTAIVLFIA
jgi:hemolysin III